MRESGKDQGGGVNAGGKGAGGGEVVEGAGGGEGEVRHVRILNPKKSAQQQRRIKKQGGKVDTPEPPNPYS